MSWRERRDVPEVLRRRIYEVVAAVPRGRVATYGDIAIIVGGDCDARTVGYALNAIPKLDQQPSAEETAEAGVHTLPWQRIINAAGGISTSGLLQRKLLEDEGVVFDSEGRVSLQRYRWQGPSPEWAAEHGFNPLPPRDDDGGEQLSLF